MTEREEQLMVVYQLIVEGYSQRELIKMVMTGELFHLQYGKKYATSLVSEARELCKIEPEESEILYDRLLYIYKGCIKKEDYGNAIKAVKELKEFSGNSDKEVTIKFVK